MITHALCPERRVGGDQGQYILAARVADRFGNTQPQLEKFARSNETADKYAREARDERLPPRREQKLLCGVQSCS